MWQNHCLLKSSFFGKLFHSGRLWGLQCVIKKMSTILVVMWGLQYWVQRFAKRQIFLTFSDSNSSTSAFCSKLRRRTFLASFLGFPIARYRVKHSSTPSIINKKIHNNAVVPNKKEIRSSNQDKRCPIARYKMVLGSLICQFCKKGKLVATRKKRKVKLLPTILMLCTCALFCPVSGGVN